MAIKITKPDMLSSANLNAIGKANSGFISNYQLGQHRELGLEILNASNGGLIYLKPETKTNGESAYIINIKGKVHEIPCQDAFGSYWKLDSQASGGGTAGIDMVNKIGYRVDGSQAYTGGHDQLLSWAFANDNNTEFQGFGYSKQPFGFFAAIANGNMGSLATITNLGLINSAPARAFTVGATVIVFRGTSPWPGLWNYGTIQSIDSNTQLTVQLYPSLGIGNANVTTGTGTILQLDKFFPWNGRTDTSDQADRTFKQNYRLVGQTILNDGYNILMTRKSTNPWCRVPYNLATTAYYVSNHTHASATTTTLNSPLARMVPLWSDAVILNLETYRDGWDINAVLRNQWGVTSWREWEVTDTFSFGYQCQQIPVKLNQDMLIETELTTTGAGGTATFVMKCFGYHDGGLREL